MVTIEVDFVKYNIPQSWEEFKPAELIKFFEFDGSLINRLLFAVGIPVHKLQIEDYEAEFANGASLFGLLEPFFNEKGEFEIVLLKNKFPTYQNIGNNFTENLRAWDVASMSFEQFAICDYNIWLMSKETSNRYLRESCLKLIFETIYQKIDDNGYMLPFDSQRNRTTNVTIGILLSVYHHYLTVRGFLLEKYKDNIEETSFDNPMEANESFLINLALMSENLDFNTITKQPYANILLLASTLKQQNPPKNNG